MQQFKTSQMEWIVAQANVARITLSSTRLSESVRYLFSSVRKRIENQGLILVMACTVSSYLQERLCERNIILVWYALLMALLRPYRWMPRHGFLLLQQQSPLQPMLSDT